MKKLLLLLMTVLTLVSCSKSDSLAPTSPIVGEWTLQAGVQVITFRDGSSVNRSLTSAKKAKFSADGRLTDGLDEFLYSVPTGYVYNATTSKLIVGDGATPWIFEVVALTQNNLRLTIVTPPSAGDGSFSTYSYSYVK
jgi:hypothetical protein